MNVTEPFVLKNDIVLIPCAELSDDMRGRISFDDGDFTLLRRHGRAAAQVIDGESAALLALFRRPRTIANAVIENSRALGKSPQLRLDELLPHLGAFLESGVLVPAGSEEAQEIRPRYDSGAAIAGWKVVRCASLAEDSEVYQVGRGGDLAALKIARIGSPMMHALFENEAAVLRHLDGSGVAPAPIDAGVYDERPYLTAEWIAGVDASVAAAQRRHDRPALIDLCASIAAAYAALHERGVLHGDVHPRNVLTVGDGVRLVDFGFACLAGQSPRLGRAGVTYFHEPEYAAALRQGTEVQPSQAGEQYALGALLYLLITGHHSVDFRYDRDEMLRQVECDPALPFAARGIPPWPEVERILSRALQKDPLQRHGSMAEMAALLAAVCDETHRTWMAAPISAGAAALLETTLQSFARGGAMFAARYPVAPVASINYGCAGAAVGLLRIAEARGDAALLALAGVWRSRAAALIGTDGAYYNDEDHLEREEIGEVSPYHTEAGIHAAAAMISAATGDVVSRQRAVNDFLRASNRPCPAIDLTLGRSGSLLAAAMLLALGGDPEETAPLRAFGAQTLQAIWSELDRRPAVGASLDPAGMAHGWAGYLYATLRWCASSGDALPPRFAARLGEHAALSVPYGRGVRWPHSGPLTASWCNGSAGQLFLFTLADRVLGGGEWLRLAELSAWTTWDEPRALSDLCCGSAGRAYALLNLYKHTGAPEWLARARRLANHAASAAAATAARPNALWKGELGVAALIADLTSPETARMPFFE